MFLTSGKNISPCQHGVDVCSVLDGKIFHETNYLESFYVEFNRYQALRILLKASSRCNQL
jgi:hypothetical protein